MTWSKKGFDFGWFRGVPRTCTSRSRRRLRVGFCKGREETFCAFEALSLAYLYEKFFHQTQRRLALELRSKEKQGPRVQETISRQSQLLQRVNCMHHKAQRPRLSQCQAVFANCFFLQFVSAAAPTVDNTTNEGWSHGGLRDVQEGVSLSLFEEKHVVASAAIHSQTTQTWTLASGRRCASLKGALERGGFLTPEVRRVQSFGRVSDFAPTCSEDNHKSSPPLRRQFAWKSDGAPFLPHLGLVVRQEFLQVFEEVAVSGTDSSTGYDESALFVKPSLFRAKVLGLL